MCLQSKIQGESGLFDMRTPPPLLMIIDRRSDPVTPLLTQWTYQAMLHEEFGLKNGKVAAVSGNEDLKVDLLLTSLPDTSSHIAIQ